jgi:hypothetical protein
MSPESAVNAYWSPDSLRALGVAAPNLQHLLLDLKTTIGAGYTEAATSLLAHLPPGLKCLDLSVNLSQCSSSQHWSNWLPATSLQELNLTVCSCHRGQLPVDWHPIKASSIEALTVYNISGVAISPVSLCNSLPTSLQKLSVKLIGEACGPSAMSMSHLTRLQVCVD